MIRPYDASDEPEVLDLINANRIPAQPQVSAEMLASALAGRSPIDSSFWAELDHLITAVARDESGQLKGIISFAARQRDQAGVILWLYAEQAAQPIIAALIEHALADFGRRTVVAFDFASALTLGLEALPVRHCATTRRALEALGFVGSDDWRYIRLPLDRSSAAIGAPDVEIIESDIRPGWELMMCAPDGSLVGEASIGQPVDGIGVLWWITIAPAHRGQGLGRKLLGQCFSHLAAAGAREVIAFVDDDAPRGDERDRTPANRLYDSMGFEELDRLWSFTRRPEGIR
jgi:ribosomal protein S18 acetylase RimI-like enzyme